MLLGLNIRHFSLAKKGVSKVPRSNASETYEEYVKKIETLTPEEQLSLLEILSAAIKKSLRAKRVKHSVLELEGLGAEIWKMIDAQEYVRKERNSWD